MLKRYRLPMSVQRNQLNCLYEQREQREARGGKVRRRLTQNSSSRNREDISSTTSTSSILLFPTSNVVNFVCFDRTFPRLVPRTSIVKEK